MKKEDYLKAKQLVQEYEAQLTSTTKKPKPTPPELPLCRVMREGVGRYCVNCGSTMTRRGFLGLYGELLCHNTKCINSNSKKKPRS